MMRKRFGRVAQAVVATAVIVGASLAVAGRADAAQKTFTSCSTLTPWETHFSVYYYNPTLNGTIYVRTRNGNLYAVPVSNDYLGQNVKGKQWRAVGTIPSASSLPDVAILTATEITSATCI